MPVAKMRPSGDCAKKRTRRRPLAATLMSKACGQRERDGFTRRVSERVGLAGSGPELAKRPKVQNTVMARQQAKDFKDIRRIGRG